MRDKKGSFERIDYSLRPAKHAERRMMAEIFRKSRPFGRVEDYRYVGFGSLWFSDFTLFHRSLGISDMLSIEKDEKNEERFKHNKPFAAIEMDFRESSKVLPDLPWDKPAFVWLDYDDTINKGMLLDVQTIIQKAVSGTVLAVTVQCMRAPEAPRNGETPAEGEPPAIERFRDRLGVSTVPKGKGEADLFGWPFGELSRDIFSAQIETALSIRNGETDPEEQMQFVPICDITYMDGAKMTTIVGIIAQNRDMKRVEECGFDALEFLPPDSRLVDVEIPILTVREIRDLERQLPLKAVPDYGHMPQEQADNFIKFYRYFPNFAVLEQ
jgi:hypothetical protein